MDETKSIRVVKVSLLTGIIVSGAMLVFGLIKSLATNQFRPEGKPPQVAALVQGALHLDGLSLLYLGLLCLMCTPVIRVAALTISWAAQGERKFAAIAGLVFALLAASIYYGTA